MKNPTALSQMALPEYFEQPDTPSLHSPVGVLMVRVIEKNPSISLELAREEAHRLLGKAAGRRVYSFPRVLSAAEQEAEKARLRAAFGSPVSGSEPRRMARRVRCSSSVAAARPGMGSRGLESLSASDVGVNP